MPQCPSPPVPCIQIYVEIERARLTRQLATIKEADGEIDEAAEIMQEVAVETFGAMAKSEKIAFILDQVRLCLDRKDFTRALILSKKVSPRVFKSRTEEAGEIGIEGTAIEAPAEVCGTGSCPAPRLLTRMGPGVDGSHGYSSCRALDLANAEDMAIVGLAKLVVMTIAMMMMTTAMIKTMIKVVMARLMMVVVVVMTIMTVMARLMMVVRVMMVVAVMTRKKR